MYYTVYQTTNTINGKIYIGVHQTDTLNDHYLGSGVALQKAIKKYGEQCFKKKYLAIFDNPEDMFQMEAVLVNANFIKNSDNYNLIKGGVGGHGGSRSGTYNRICVKDEKGNIFSISRDDSRFISKEVVPIATGCVTVKDSEGNVFRVPKNDPRYVSGELISCLAKTVTVIDIDNNIFRVHTEDPRYLSGELKTITHNTICVKDSAGNKYRVAKDEPRYLSGELVGITKGCTHSSKTKEKMSLAKKGKCSGEHNNQFGKVWVSDIEKQISYTVLLSELPDVLKSPNIKKMRIIDFDKYNTKMKEQQSKQETHKNVTEEQKQQLRTLFDTYINGPYRSINEFVKKTGYPKTSQSLGRLWKMHVSEYSNYVQPKRIKKGE